MSPLTGVGATRRATDSASAISTPPARPASASEARARATGPDDAVLQEVIRRIVEVARPERIILFGSGARKQMGPHSDLDLLLIKEGQYEDSRLLGEIYRRLIGVGQGVDLLLVTPRQVERYRDSPYLVVAPALREGREVYRAQRVLA